MLLRRITKHVTDQNWFAVFIDFLIVVIGVFIGIQVANWNESRFTEEEAQLAKVNLIADLKNDRDVYKVRKKFYGEVRKKAISVIQLLEQNFPESTEVQWQLVHNSLGAGSMWPFKPSGQIYNQLLNSGKLDLVSDSIVLRQLRDYYQDAALEAGQTFKFDSKFRTNSRSLINWKLESYRRDQCDNAIGLDPAIVIETSKAYIKDCPAPQLPDEIKTSARAIFDSKSLRQDINLALSQIGTTLSFINYFDDEAEDLIATLENQ